MTSEAPDTNGAFSAVVGAVQEIWVRIYGMVLWNASQSLDKRRLLSFQGGVPVAAVHSHATDSLKHGQTLEAEQSGSSEALGRQHHRIKAVL